MITFKPQSVSKFFFLDYLYVLLKSVENYNEKDKVFNSFKILKQKHQLGESKYKKLSVDSENLSRTQMVRYYYTFEQVIQESLEYRLIRKDKNENLYITDKGIELLETYDERNPHIFYKAIFPLMEKSFYAISYLLDFCYKANNKRGGLLIFPIYSPLKLHFDRSEIKTARDIHEYAIRLKSKLEESIQEYLDINLDLSAYNNELIQRLINVQLLPKNKSEKFSPKKYNVIIKRFRDFWINIFLKEIYKYKYSFNSFDIWIYRAKQIGIFHVTEFYPGFSGRIVYPTSIITKEKVVSDDFESLFEYPDGKKLYMHNPSWTKEDTQENFVKSLTDSYIDIRKSNRNYYINLADLREYVCYKMKIAAYIFDDYLEKAYKLNISGKLRVNISLEADKIPYETNAIYLKREPVMIEGKYRNIIAIDITRGAKKHGKYRQIY